MAREDRQGVGSGGGECRLKHVSAPRAARKCKRPGACPAGRWSARNAGRWWLESERGPV